MTMILVCDGTGKGDYCPKPVCDNCGGIRDGYMVVRDTVAVSSALQQIEAEKKAAVEMLLDFKDAHVHGRKK